MAPSPLRILIPWIALACLGRVLLAPGERTPLQGGTGADASGPDCGNHACGCDHEAPAAACCCGADGDRAGAPAPGRVARGQTPVTGLAVRAEGMHGPACALESQECAGGRRTDRSARAGSAPIGPWDTTSGAGHDDERGWRAAPPGPPPRSLWTEPPAPPPRAPAQHT